MVQCEKKCCPVCDLDMKYDGQKKRQNYKSTLKYASITMAWMLIISRPTRKHEMSCEIKFVIEDEATTVK